MSSLKTIAIVVDPRIAFGQAVMEGVSRFNVEHDAWHILTTSGLPYVPLNLVGRWKGDGVIGVAGRELGPLLLRRGIPFVNIATYFGGCPVPSVTVDNRAIGQLAAEHLLDKGLRKFVVVSWREQNRWETRCASFERTVGEAGFPCRRLYVADRMWQGEAAGFDLRRVRTLLRRDGQGLGVFAVHDTIARGIVGACREERLRVPEDVAVLGEGNWRIICEMIRPQLTSVDSGADRVGYRAAQLLAEMMDGARPPAEAILIPPRRVVQRESTDVLAVDDDLVRRAVRFIKDSYRTGLQVPDVAEAAASNRRTLEKRFRVALGRTVHEEIRRVRIHAACEMLVQTDMTVQNIVAACGYKSWERFSAAFRKETGMNPSVFRKTRGYLGGSAH